VLAGHHDDEVLGAEVGAVGVGAGSRDPVDPSAVQGTTRARVHRAADVPVGRPGAGDVDAAAQNVVLGHQVRQGGLGHGGPADISGADHGDPEGWFWHAAPL